MQSSVPPTLTESGSALTHPAHRGPDAHGRGDLNLKLGKDNSVPCQAAAHCWHCHTEGSLPFSFCQQPPHTGQGGQTWADAGHPPQGAPPGQPPPNLTRATKLQCPSPALPVTSLHRGLLCRPAAPNGPLTLPNPQAAAEPKLTRTHQHFPAGPPGEESTPQTLTCECTGRKRSHCSGTTRLHCPRSGAAPGTAESEDLLVSGRAVGTGVAENWGR